jgi:hypothetical protein
MTNKSWVANLLLVALFTSVQPAIAAEITESAWAQWIYTESGRVRSISVVAETRHSPSGIETRLEYVESNCRTRKRHLRCVEIRRVTRALPNGAFDVDPLLGVAHLRFPLDGYKNRVSWSDPEAQSGYYTTECGPANDVKGAGLERHSTARGTVVGRTFETSGVYDWSALFTGVETQSCS